MERIKPVPYFTASGVPFTYATKEPVRTKLFASLVNVQHLNLERCSLSELPPGIKNLSNLTYLNINQNNLTTLPDEISQLRTLTFLYASQNRLQSTTIPSSFEELRQLKVSGNNNIVLEKLL